VHDESTGHASNPALTELRKKLSDGLARARLGKTQLAARAALGRTTVQQAFRPDGPVPSAETVAALARALMLPVEELLQLQRDAAGGGGSKRSGFGKPTGERDSHSLKLHQKVPVGNEISGGQIHGPVVQAHTIHGDVRINSGWDARSCAEMVTAWTGPGINDCAARAAADDGEWSGYHFHSIVVHNGGPQPIHDVTVCIPTPTAHLLPGEEPLAMVAVGLVPPGERREVQIGDCGQFEPQFAVPLDVVFSTADGTRWRRDEHGQLFGCTAV